MSSSPGIKDTQPVDAYVGARIRLRRNLLGISQTELGDRIGVTFQQVQKYEKGVNRIGVSRLAKICDVLQITPAWLFEGAPGASTRVSAQTRDMDAAFSAFAADRIAPRVVAAWARLPKRIRRVLADLIIAIATGPAMPRE
jgi:transcriptional regulator with XRE-family HTH domain